MPDKNMLTQAMTQALEKVDFEDIVKGKVEEAVGGALGDFFSWNGAGKKAIDAALKEALVPTIERFDFSQFAPKLDAVLAEIALSPALAQNRQAIENFGKLFAEVPGETTCAELFDEYCKYVAERADCCGREVDTDDEPTYLPVEVSLTCETERRGFVSKLEGGILEFRVVDSSLENADDLAKTVLVDRWDEGPWGISSRSVPSMRDVLSISLMDRFDLHVLKLVQNNTTISDPLSDMTESVEPDDRPEADWV